MQQRGFGIFIQPQHDGSRLLLVKEVEQCEVFSHMSISELKDYVVSETTYTVPEKKSLLLQIEDLRKSAHA